MAARESQGGAASELRAFIAFLSTVWGALAGMSVLFPLSNELLDVVPLAEVTDDPTGALASISPAIVSTVASVAALFAVLWLFARRQQLSGEVVHENSRAPWVLFVVGLGLLIGYLVVYEVKVAHAYQSWGWESDSAAHLLLDVPLLVLYCGFFVSVTSAFVLLALRMFFSERSGGRSTSDASQTVAR